MKGFHVGIPAACLMAATMFGISGAAADVAAHPFADFGIGELGGRLASGPRSHSSACPCWLSAEHSDGGADLAGGAIAALKAVMLDKGRLQRMQMSRHRPRPSIVVMDWPSCITASVRQELMRRPSISTVQAPH